MPNAVSLLVLIKRWFIQVLLATLCVRTVRYSLGVDDTCANNCCFCLQVFTKMLLAARSPEAYLPDTPARKARRRTVRRALLFTGLAATTAAAGYLVYKYARSDAGSSSSSSADGARSSSWLGFNGMGPKSPSPRQFDGFDRPADGSSSGFSNVFKAR